MRFPLIILSSFAVVACREEKNAQAHNAPLTKAIRTVSPSAASSSLPPPLLHTSRVTISFTGHGVSCGNIENVDQAEAALADIRSLPPSAGRDFATRCVIAGLAKVDPAQARTLLEKWDDALICSWLDVAEIIAKKLAETDPQAAADFIGNSVQRASQAKLWGGFLSALPPGARLSFFGKVPESSAKLRMAADLISVWLSEDPASCAAWLDAYVADKAAGEMSNLNHAQHTDSRNKTETDAWLSAFRAAQGAAAKAIFAEGAWRSADKGMRAGLIPELQDVIPKLIADEKDGIIAADPQGYAAALSPARIAALTHDEAAKIISPWAATHPLEAIQWGLDHNRPEAASALGALYRQEPKTAIDLVPKLPGGKDRDQAISMLCYSLIKDQGADAAKAMLPLISDPKFRENMRKEIEHDWD